MTLKTTFASLAAAAVLCAITLAAKADETPPALKALEQQGITIVGTFPSKTGLKAYAATSQRVGCLAVGLRHA